MKSFNWNYKYNDGVIDTLLELTLEASQAPSLQAIISLISTQAQHPLHTHISRNRCSVLLLEECSSPRSQIIAVFTIDRDDTKVNADCTTFPASYCQNLENTKRRPGFKKELQNTSDIVRVDGILWRDFVQNRVQCVY